MAHPLFGRWPRVGGGRRLETSTASHPGVTSGHVRFHNFSISLDGFATGEGQTLDAPFGHAGHRLHE